MNSDETALKKRLDLMFIHSRLDEAGLDPFEFRLLGHIVRRTGGSFEGECFASQVNISKVCQMSLSRAQKGLRLLNDGGFISKHERPGRTDVYRLEQPENWKSPSELKAIRKKLRNLGQKNN
ncbi:hypothetical protein [Acaryochloris marina]|uniref:hypothetical protein n=1 Tax=Acaryochloris marina TaxID=155978 RepID=UPI001BAEB564|nr:hypothetical protein [Acaryochloris marina]QUY40424.1 helix-turn-helix domain-containing protein [Acaryochloris marina S15]